MEGVPKCQILSLTIKLGNSGGYSDLIGLNMLIIIIIIIIGLLQTVGSVLKHIEPPVSFFMCVTKMVFCWEKVGAIWWHLCLVPNTYTFTYSAISLSRSTYKV